MGAARKIEKTPAEVYLEQKVRSGEAVAQDFSMKELGEPDPAFQSRVGIDMDHVKALSEVHDREGRLARVVIFLIAGVPKLVSGFHRHRVYKNKKLDSIPAWVIEGPAHEAIRFSVGSNRRFSKPMTANDKRKATIMYFKNDDLAGVPFDTIAAEVGTRQDVVERCWLSWCEDNKLDPSARGVAEPTGPIRYKTKVDPETGKETAFVERRRQAAGRRQMEVEVVPLGPAGTIKQRRIERELAAQPKYRHENRQINKREIKLIEGSGGFPGSLRDKGIPCRWPDAHEFGEIIDFSNTTADGRIAISESLGISFILFDKMVFNKAHVYLVGVICIIKNKYPESKIVFCYSGINEPPKEVIDYFQGTWDVRFCHVKHLAEKYGVKGHEDQNPAPTTEGDDEA